MKKYVYPALVVLLYIGWLSYMLFSNSWNLFIEHWIISITMTFSAFLGSSTPFGGGGVAFPVCTKWLKMATADARTFSLMIQSFGMTMASAFILVRGIAIIKPVVLWVTLGGIIGIVLGSLVPLPAPYPKVLFSFVAATFAVAMLIGRWLSLYSFQESIAFWNRQKVLLFLIIGLLGGFVSANTGAGTNLLTFIVLSLLFGINEKIAIPTAVVVMALNAVAGFIVHGFMQDIGIAWDYWLVSVPIVIVFAPLGAFVASKVKKKVIVIAVVLMAFLELVTTLWFVSFTSYVWGFAALVTIIVGLLFWLMIRLRRANTLSSEL